MPYSDLRDFIAQLEALGELKRVTIAVDPHLEMTEICDRVLKANGPAILFERPRGFDGIDGRPHIPVLGNLFGTPRRVALAMGAAADDDPLPKLREIGELLAFLKEPAPPTGWKDAWERWTPIAKHVLHMAPKEI